jgi:hypothetical protein
MFLLYDRLFLLCSYLCSYSKFLLINVFLLFLLNTHMHTCIYMYPYTKKGAVTENSRHRPDSKALRVGTDPEQTRNTRNRPRTAGRPS